MNWVEYHRGYLPEDRAKNEKLDFAAADIWADYEKGKLHLRQKRLGEAMYSYEYKTARK